MSKIVEQIQANVISKLHFTSADDEVIDDVTPIIDAIKSNSSIECVEFLDDFLGCIRNDSRTELLQALCKVPCLNEVHLEDGLIMIDVIADLITKCKGLKILTLNRIILQGVQEDFDTTEMALHQNHSLKELTIKDCSSAIEGIFLNNLVLHP